MAEIAWLVSNWTDRLILFLLILVAPTGLQGPLRWIVQRPTRRVGLYVVLGLLAAVLKIGG
jgi:hypothetical protein